MAELLKGSRHELDMETTARKQLAARVADMKEQMSRHQQRVVLVENEAKEARAQAEAALAAKDAALMMVCACCAGCWRWIVPVLWLEGHGYRMSAVAHGGAIAVLGPTLEAWAVVCVY